MIDNAFVCLSLLQYVFKELAEKMQTKSNKWQTSLNQIEKAKEKWRQFSVEKRAVLQQLRLLSFTELQEKYSTIYNLPDFFWRDNGETKIYFLISLIII